MAPRTADSSPTHLHIAEPHVCDELGDSGRFDLSGQEISGIVVAILTAAQESPGLPQTYLEETFRTEDAEDLISALRAQGRIIGQLVAVVTSPRHVPAWRPHLDQYIRDLALIRASSEE